MNNRDIAAIFEEMAALAELAGGDPFRIRAFRRIAQVVSGLPEPVAILLRRGALGHLPGIGTGALNRIKRIEATGTCEEHQRLLGQIPRPVLELLELRGAGPGLVRRLFRELGIGSVEALEQELSGNARRLEAGLGAPTIATLREALVHYRRAIRPMYVDEAEHVGELLLAALAERDGVVRLQLAGSLRRGKELVGDLDILLASDNPASLSDALAAHPLVAEVLSRGEGRTSLRIRSGHQVDLRLIRPHNLGAALHYFTGSKAHNIDMRARALRLGFKLSDHGLMTRDGERIVTSGATEEELFAALRLQPIPAELREAAGEIELAERFRLPTLIERSAIGGELLCQTSMGAGGATAEEWLEAAELAGFRYLAICDDLEQLRVPLGDYLTHLEGLARRSRVVRLLVGARFRLSDRPLPAELLAQRERLQWIAAEPRLSESRSAEENARAMIVAIESGLIDCLLAPLQRRVGERHPPPLDHVALCNTALRHGVAFALCGDPRRLDPDPIFCRFAVERGAALVLSADPKGPSELVRLRYAVKAARRGWVPLAQVVNAWPLDAIATWRGPRSASQRAPRATDQDATAIPQATDEDGTAVPLATDEDSTAILRTMDEGRSASPRSTDEGRGSIPVASGLDELHAELAREPLSDILLERLRRFLMGEIDPELEAALAGRGPNPLATAFALLSQRGGQDPTQN